MGISSDSISAELDKQSTSALMAEMHRRSKSLNEPLAQSVKSAAWSIASALASATSVSPKVREVQADPARKTIRGKKPWKVKVLRKNRTRLVDIYARNKSEAKKSRVAQIGNRGLAKRTWQWQQGALGARGSQIKVGPKAFASAQRHGRVEKHLKGDDPHVRLRNLLPYAVAAIRGSGEQTIHNVMERASRILMHKTERDFARIMNQ